MVDGDEYTTRNYCSWNLFANLIKGKINFFDFIHYCFKLLCAELLKPLKTKLKKKKKKKKGYLCLNERYKVPLNYYLKFERRASKARNVNILCSFMSERERERENVNKVGKKEIKSKK